MTTALGREHRAASRPQLWHISERATFAALRQSDHRARSGSVTVTWLPAVAPGPRDQPRVAFAVGRPVGNAVVRNRIRRRLRAALRHLQVQAHLPLGAYLVGGRTELATMSWADVVASVDAAVAAATSESPT